MAAVFLLAITLSLSAGAAGPPVNFFANPGFELGRDGWQASKAGKTECQFSVDEKDAAEGQHSALLTLNSVEDWGLQFGQSFSAGGKGKTYTLAVFAKSTSGPVAAGLQIERNAKPWDRAVGVKLKLTDQWQEFHVTFAVEKDFPEGWFAYLSCTQPRAVIRADMFRLCEGPYVPYKEIAQAQAAIAGVRLFDTGSPSPAPLNAQALSKKPGWREVPEDNVTHKFKGDAVLLNDRLVLALRLGGAGAEAYSLGPDGSTLRTTLTPLALHTPHSTLNSPTQAPRLASFTVVENNPGAGIVDVCFTRTAGRPSDEAQTSHLRFELRVGQPFVQTEAGPGTSSLRVGAPCRFLVMPDFFADDIVIDAAELPVKEAELPSDNFLLHLLPDRQAILMTVAKTSDEDIRVALAGDGDQRHVEGSELPYGKDGKIWVGIMTATPPFPTLNSQPSTPNSFPSLWHTEKVAAEQAGTVVRLDWKAPFPAQWRIDWRRPGNLTDSWEMINERPDGSFVKHSVFGGPETIPSNRKRWTTVLGTFDYPAWVDKTGQGYLQPLKTSALRFEGPAVIYPMNRVSATGLESFTVLDIVRNTLGVGPCEYILDVEAQQSKYRGRATCSVRDTLNPIYASKQQKQHRAEIEKVLEDLMVFIRHIRGRIEIYVAFGHETLACVAEQKKSHPELAESLAQVEILARSIDAKVEARKVQIKTPEEAAKMVEAFRQTVLDYDGEDALDRCRQFTEGWVGIGGNQDELVGECRWAVKMIRQRAGLLMATDPRVAPVAKEIRRRSQEVLRNPAIHEGARH